MPRFQIALYDVKTKEDSHQEKLFGVRIKFGSQWTELGQQVIPLSHSYDFFPPSLLFFYLPRSAGAIDVEIVRLDTHQTVGDLRLPLTSATATLSSLPLGLASFRAWQARAGHEDLAGTLRVGLKLVPPMVTLTKMGEWRGFSAGGSLEHATWVNNVQYLFSLDAACAVQIKLRSSAGGEHLIVFYVFKVASPQDVVAKRKLGRDDMLKMASHLRLTEFGKEALAAEVYLTPGAYIFLPCVEFPAIEGSFELSVAAPRRAFPLLEAFESDELNSWEENEDHAAAAAVASASTSVSAVAKGKEKEKKEGAATTTTFSDYLQRQQQERERERARGGGEASSLSPALERSLSACLDLGPQPFPDTAFLSAAAAGDLDTIKRELKVLSTVPRTAAAAASSRGPDPAAQMRRALALSAAHEHWDVAQFLLSKGATARAEAGERAPLLDAALRGQARVARAMLERGGADVTQADALGNTCLMYALQGKGTPTAAVAETCKVLLKQRPNVVNDCNHAGHTPLMCAARRGAPELLTMLLEHNALPGVWDRMGRTALHYACMAGHLECARRLLATGGAAPRARDAAGETCVFKAAIRGHMGVLRLLLERAEEKKQADDAEEETLIVHRDSEGELKTCSLYLMSEEEMLSNFKAHYEMEKKKKEEAHAAAKAEAAASASKSASVSAEGSAASSASAGGTPAVLASPRLARVSPKKERAKEKKEKEEEGEEKKEKDEEEKEKEKSDEEDLEMQDDLLGIKHRTADSREVLQVIIIMSKMGDRHSFFQVLSKDGHVISMNLMLEEARTDVVSTRRSRSRVRSTLTKKHKLVSDSSSAASSAAAAEAGRAGEPGASSSASGPAVSSAAAAATTSAYSDRGGDGMDGGGSAQNATQLMARGQLEILCLLIERGDLLVNLEEGHTELSVRSADHAQFDAMLGPSGAILEEIRPSSEPDGGSGGVGGGAHKERETQRLKRNKGRRTLLAGDFRFDKGGGGARSAASMRRLRLAILDRVPGEVTSVLERVEFVTVTIIDCVSDAKRRFSSMERLYLCGVVYDRQQAIPPVFATGMKVSIWVKEARGLPPHATQPPPERAVEVAVEGVVKSVKGKKKDVNPKWGERLRLQVRDPTAVLDVRVIESAAKERKVVAEGKVELAGLRAKSVSKWYKLDQGEICLKINLQI